MANKSLLTAKASKNDEFYTQYDDIAAELKHYSTFLRGKVVFCNCDDPTWSNFWKYLHNNFSVLGLKKLISTHYEADGSPSYKMEYEGGDDLNTEVGITTPLKGNGDFRSEECMEILRSCDVVITNPPFSLFREYMKSLVDSDKRFIIIGTMNSLHYKEIFPLIKENKVSTTPTIHHEWMGLAGEGSPFSVSPVDQPQPRQKGYVTDKYAREPHLCAAHVPCVQAPADSPHVRRIAPPH